MRAGLAGVTTARSRIVQHAGRTFLESERFDRHGLFGRSRLVSLVTLDAAFIGAPTTDWTRLAAALQAIGLLSVETVERIGRLGWFGRLIANTDMHTGNLSFVPHQVLELAPAHDMLPMHYAPLAGGELPTRPFDPPLPLPAQRATWQTACGAAVEFWDRIGADLRIGTAFRQVGQGNAGRLRKLADRT